MPIAVIDERSGTQTDDQSRLGRVAYTQFNRSFYAASGSVSFFLSFLHRLRVKQAINSCGPAAPP